MAIRKKGDERGKLERAEKWQRQTNVRQTVRQTCPLPNCASVIKGWIQSAKHKV
jgi:hypothetical protein